MRKHKFGSAAAVAALTGVAVLGLAPNASAETPGTCWDNYENAVSGYMSAYDKINCDGFLGMAKGNDKNWGDKAGSFQGNDIFRASSLVNKGTRSEVKFFLGSGANSNFHICLTRAEGFVRDLRDDYWLGDKTFGSVNNSIGSHIWVGRTACSFLAV
ncbi:hypothetical protein OIE82_16075 [Streptomyces althioticus]|uniref:Secreted protein n=1 Tax=Streptomyces althioticus TaxID=83380 RepID=A0ABZ1Y5B8_9ACTN|nr:hypothetical protein OG968_16140 [Streptomyces althioticus]WTB93842.1 hypothetical protein OHA53_19405 [Streptomyces althioticus]GGQ44871.1 hypothetical protein GCM10010267_03870 [Streptomyces griseorubens]